MTAPALPALAEGEIGELPAQPAISNARHGAHHRPLTNVGLNVRFRMSGHAATPMPGWPGGSRAVYVGAPARRPAAYIFGLSDL
jgi:hypothetical protein